MTVKQLMYLSRKIEETSTFIDNIENDNFLIDLLIHIFFPDRGVPAEFFKIDVEQLGLKIIWRVASILFSLHCHSGKF